MAGNYPDRLVKLQPLLGDWRLDRLIGAGTFGRVYRVVREELGEVYEAALKWIPLPKDDSEMEQIGNEGIDPSHYYRSLASDIQTEVKLLRNLRVSNVVSYEDHLIRQREDGIGWDVLIRMELLTSMTDYFKKRKIESQDIIRLGMDVCAALEECRRKNIIHRDIKPDNIFVSQRDEGAPVYKLGDFGIARQMERTLANMSIKGTYNYMAPEVYKGEEYGGSVDLYSLGMVMYRMLNGLRGPFLSASSAAVTQAQLDDALKRRMSGEPIPRPVHCDDSLWAVIRKACAANPEKRYKTPMEMRGALQALLSGPAKPEPGAGGGTGGEPRVNEVLSGQKDEVVPPQKNADGTISLVEGSSAHSVSNNVSVNRGGSKPQVEVLHTGGGVILKKDAKARKEKQPKGHRVAVALITMILLACVAAAGWLYVTMGSDITDLKLSRAAETYLNLRWESEGEGPWEVWYAPAGIAEADAQRVTTGQTIVTLNKLIPGTKYKISVASAGRKGATLLASTTAAQRYTQYNTEVSWIELHLYDTGLLETMSQTEILMDSSESLTVKITEDEPARLQNMPINQQNRGVLLVYQFLCDQTQDQKHFNIQTVIRQNEGQVYVDERLFEPEGQKPITTYYLDLEKLLAKLFVANGKWPKESLAVEVYFNGALLASVPLRIETVTGG